MALIDVLTTLANTLQIERTNSNQIVPGAPVQLRLAPPINTLSVTDLLAAPVSLDFITKMVEFTSASREPTPLTGVTPAGGTPLGETDVIDTSTISAVTKSITTTVTLSDPTAFAKGLLGQVTGGIPVPVTIPVSASVEWHVYDDTNADITTQLPTLGGFALPEVTVILPVATAELTSDAPVPGPRIYTVEARVSLHCHALLDSNPVDVGPISLPRFPLPVPVIPIPTIIAVFQHSLYHGHLLISVPQNSALAFLAGQAPAEAQQQLTALLADLRSTVMGLVHLPSFASFLLGLNQLVDALPKSPHFRFVPGDGEPDDGVPNFNNIKMGYRDDTGVNVVYHGDDTDVTANDSTSSLILIGPEDRFVDLFNTKDYDGRHGSFQIKLGPELFALVPNLTMLDEEEAPISVPLERCHVTQYPSDLALPPDFHGRPPDPLPKVKFNDRLSSLRFGRTTIAGHGPASWPIGMGLPISHFRRTTAASRGRS